MGNRSLKKVAIIKAIQIYNRIRTNAVQYNCLKKYMYQSYLLIFEKKKIEICNQNLFASKRLKKGVVDRHTLL